MTNIASQIKNDEGQSAVFNREDKPGNWTWNIETPYGYDVFNMVQDMKSMGFKLFPNENVLQHTPTGLGGNHFEKQIDGNWYHLIFVSSRNPLHPFRAYFEGWHYDRYEPFSLTHLKDAIEGGSENGKRAACQKH